MVMEMNIVGIVVASGEEGCKSQGNPGSQKCFRIWSFIWAVIIQGNTDVTSSSYTLNMSAFSPALLHAYYTSVKKKRDRKGRKN